ncbi:MAG: phosphomannomutase/phosphoglucomutase [Gammaproteobacteria bacterium]|nr:phosphomannomutase/phosphoglucomutase [Gammaproteobacteria bacterium]MBI5616367.1 phosphomannomutase/phosphoglucomutase [Gammaproteobacteria bacterium]
MRKPSLNFPTGFRPDRRHVMLVLGVVALLLVLSGGYGLYTRYVDQREKAAEAAEQAKADALAQDLGSVLAVNRKLLLELAADPKVLAALSGADDEVRKVLAAEAQGKFANALILRLVPRGASQPDSSSTPPLTYASVELMHQNAAGTKPIAAELNLGGTPQEHIVLIQRVPAQGELVGFLHLSLQVNTVRDALKKFAPPDMVAEIQQAVSKGPPVIVARAGGTPKAGVAMKSAPVPGTAWAVAIRESGVEEGPALELPPMLAPAAGLIALLALAGLAYSKRLGGHAGTTKAGRVEEGATEFQGAIKSILSGDYPGLERLLPGSDGAAVDTSPISLGLAGDDVTTLPAPADDEPSALPVTPGVAPEPSVGGVPSVIFRSYDIRGLVGKQLTEEGARKIGRAFGSEAAAVGQQTVIVARDGRSSSLALQAALVAGLREAGRDVVDIGLTPTPVLYFATNYLDTRTGVMVTGSHNPAEYNGLKMVLDGRTISGEAIQAIRRRIETDDYTSGAGSLEQLEIVPDYIRRISEEIPVSLGDSLKVVVDCGNGVPGIVAPHILRAIGHDVIELYCEVDGDFPNHHPDPSQPENLEDLITIVKHEQADLGLAFDGDGDRLGVVDRNGTIIWPDRQMMLYAQDILARNPGATIIYDVKCSKHLGPFIREHGGEPLMWKTGHSLIKAKMIETGALLAGEMSGHIFFKERWYGFDDALYGAARLLEILVNANEPPEDVFARLPGGVATPELRLDMPEHRHAEFMEQIKQAAKFPDAELNEIDGLRVDLPQGFGLVRPSNTTPCLVLRFEGDDDHALAAVKDRFRSLLLGIDATLQLPF